MSDILVVLAAHQPEAGHRDMHKHCTCGWFGGVLKNDFLPHQAAALSAAGFGLVTDAKAEAALEAAQDIVEGLTESCPDDHLSIGFAEGYRDACEDAVRNPS